MNFISFFFKNLTVFFGFRNTWYVVPFVLLERRATSFYRLDVFCCFPSNLHDLMVKFPFGPWWVFGAYGSNVEREKKWAQLEAEKHI